MNYNNNNNNRVISISRLLCRYLKQALSRSDEEFTKWVIEHPGQVVLTVVRTFVNSLWTGGTQGAWPSKFGTSVFSILYNCRVLLVAD